MNRNGKVITRDRVELKTGVYIIENIISINDVFAAEFKRFILGAVDVDTGTAHLIELTKKYNKREKKHTEAVKEIRKYIQNHYPDSELKKGAVLYAKDPQNCIIDAILRPTTLKDLGFKLIVSYV